MKTKSRRGTGSVFQFKGCAVWYIKYYRNGKMIRESSKSVKVKDAERLLAQRLGEIQNGTFTDPRDRKVTVDELYQALLDDYRVNGRRSLGGAMQRWEWKNQRGKICTGRLKDFFGGWLATNVTTESLKRYISKYLAKRLSNATVNRDLATLRRAFFLAWRSTPRRIPAVPVFPQRLKESDPRPGFVEEQEYKRLAAHAHELWLRALLVVAYNFAFRKGELLHLRVRQINLIDRTITLDPGTTKNKQGRIIVMTTDVYLLVQACCADKKPDAFVFSRSADGKEPINDFRNDWGFLCAAAGLGKMMCEKCRDEDAERIELDADGKCLKCRKRSLHPKYKGLLFHDLRRSGIRGMSRDGTPEVVIMRISGHKTRAVFDRYNIVSQSDLIDAARRIENRQTREFRQNLGRISENDDPRPAEMIPSPTRRLITN